MAPSYPNRKQRLVAKVEWRPGEIVSAIGFYCLVECDQSVDVLT